ncbi:unnamed protein product [Phyllotreta striolata]|uniref:Cysteine-rich protein 2-binding protein n=1 Tax=Phyllotreta striolata TaxID=444603 RepID=A0A9N9TE47_PHYSR|nr:unnamed protein product [Phyllotreta striolata]
MDPLNGKFCNNCGEKLELSLAEGLECTLCHCYVHVKCLKRGSVPGGLHGDTFFTFTCADCSPENSEIFVRNKLSWLQVIVLVLYHLQHKCPGLARKGFFHWRHHVAIFIDKNWDMLFSNVKKKKKWMGTIAGTLSHFNKYIFLSGISVFNEPAFWTLMYPKLSPLTVISAYSVMLAEKQIYKNKKDASVTDSDLFSIVLRNNIENEDLLQTFNVESFTIVPEAKNEEEENRVDLYSYSSDGKQKRSQKRKNHKQLGLPFNKLSKLSNSSALLSSDDLMELNFDSPETNANQECTSEEIKPDETRFLNPFCHYNTSLNSTSRISGLNLYSKLTGGIKQDFILSPYSGMYLKPYIRRDVESFPTWLKLMAEIKLSVNGGEKNYSLPPRSSLDYTYVQPEHIPAINSLCNQFFWPGIDLGETLLYPDFSCVVLYKRLIVGFAFLVPDVSHTETYLSFIFTRPYWRKCGIAKFMIYHLIQTSMGKDVTLHVSMNNPVLLLYQKFGFKVENVVLGFYDKYLREDVGESKNAFFCRLER